MTETTEEFRRALEPIGKPFQPVADLLCEADRMLLDIEQRMRVTGYVAEQERRDGKRLRLRVNIEWV